MNRERAIMKCETCGQTPHRNDQGQLVCECAGKFWNWIAPVAGSPEDRAILEHHGWQLVEVQQTYWTNPFAHVILYLYADNTWSSDPPGAAPERFVWLGDYLGWYSEQKRSAGVK